MDKVRYSPFLFSPPLLISLQLDNGRFHRRKIFHTPSVLCTASELFKKFAHWVMGASHGLIKDILQYRNICGTMSMLFGSIMFVTGIRLDPVMMKRRRRGGTPVEELQLKCYQHMRPVPEQLAPCRRKVRWKRIFQPESWQGCPMRGQTRLGRSSMPGALKMCPNLGGEQR